MLEELSTDEAIKIYKSMLLINRLGFHNSIKSMYRELEERGFNFSMCEDAIVELHKSDKEYKWIQVKFHLFLIKVNSLDNRKIVKLLKKWNTTYCMTRKDILYHEWREENVWINDSSSDIGDMLENCGIEINILNYFRNQH